MNDEKIFRKVLALTLCPLYLLIAFVAFVIFGVAKVYAEDASVNICNYNGYDYFDVALGNSTYCSGYTDVGKYFLWDGVLGINYMSTRIYYNFEKNYNYTLYVYQTIDYFTEPDNRADNKSYNARMVLANNSTNFTGNVVIQPTIILNYKHSTLVYKVQFIPNENTPYIDIDTYFRGLYFTGYGHKQIAIGSSYSMNDPEYSTSQAVEDMINSINQGNQNIINNNNQNTNNIINNNTQNTQDVINNNNQNTQDIIDNNNQNSQNIVDSINDSFTSCIEDDLTSNKTKNQKMVIDSSGLVITAPSNPKKWYVLSNINISDYQEVIISGVNASSEYYMIIQDKNKEVIKISKVQNATIKIEDNYSYLAISINSSDNISIIGKKCGNRLDNVGDKINQTNDYLMDDTPPESDISSLGNVSGLLPPGPVDSLLNIPFTFLSILTSSFGGVCHELSGTFVFNTNLTLPCFTTLFYDRVPTALMTFLDIIPTAFMLIKYFKHLYKKIERATSLEANSDDEWGVI